MGWKTSCCEVCDRSPTCGVDCGSCRPIHETLYEQAFKANDADLWEVAGDACEEAGDDLLAAICRASATFVVQNRKELLQRWLRLDEAAKKA